MSGDPVVAIVADHRIRLSAVEKRAAILRIGPAARHAAPAEAVADDWIRRWAVQQLVGEAVLAHEIRTATAPGTDGPDAPVQDLVARITAAIEISEREVQAFYERNLDRFHSGERRHVRYAIVPKRRDAERVRRRLIADGSEAAACAERWGIMELRRGEYVGAFETAVFAARVGDVVGPTLTEHGWIVALVESIAAESVVPYSLARPAIATELLDVARARAFDDWLESRRHELGRVTAELEHPAHPAHGRPRHRH
jgi:hypothetical protein